MRRFAQLALALAALALSAGPALAQVGGRGESDVSEVYGDINGGVPLSFLTDKSVQEDLKMTDQQVEKAVAASQKYNDAEQRLSSLPDQARFQKRRELSKEAYKAVKDILNADQQKRLRQISLQQLGVRALASQPIAEEVGLSEDQQNRITGLLTEANQVKRRIRQDRRWLDDNGGKADRGGRWNADGRVEQIEKKLNDKILAVLTKEQKAKWEKMNGKPFTGRKTRQAATDQKFGFVDLQPYANQKRTDNLGTGVQGNNLVALPAGTHAFGAILFRVGDGLIQLGSQVLEKMPEKVEAIQVNRKVATLHLLHATCFGGGPNKPGGVWFVADGTLIGEYRVNFHDRSAIIIPIVYGEDVRDWFFAEGEKDPSRGKVVWTGDNERAKEVGARLRLYVTTWENPWPDKMVTTIDYSSKKTVAAPFCVAITAEEK